MANITGTDGNDNLTGGAQNDTINGLAGLDTMTGGQGNDTYYVDHANDVVVELADQGIDTVISTVALSGAFANVENYDFSKLAGGVAFTGNALDNVIKGGAGADTVTGGKGNDTYYLNSTKDVVIENASPEWDTIVTTFTADLNNYANVEEIRLRGTAAINAFGNAGNNEIIGNAAANIIDGRGGADTMTGGKGNDTYYVDNAGDHVLESADGGVDTVISSVNETLDDFVENLKLTGSAVVGVGNTLKNVITGNQADNVLDGAAGADTLKGGKGNDVYYVDNAGDVVVESAGQGIDHINATIDFSLAALGNVEHLSLLGNAVKATGNALNNGLFGNHADNILDGGANGDEMWGSKGNDTYHVDTQSDLVMELLGEGTDTIISKVALGAAWANVENYDFSKVAAAVNFTGNDLDNIIKSGAGADTLAGGKANDTYHLNSTKDVVVEQPGEGTDTVVSSVISLDLAKYANVENATLLGTGALKLTGNAGANILTGNAGANALNGKGGDDTLIGGKGNDTYYVGSAGDVVTESANQGIDTVHSSVSITLAANVENLTLASGAGGISGTGNGRKNTIVGNEGDNDIDGGAGADTMKGGGGNDFYYVDNAGDRLVELTGEGQDMIKASIDFSLAALVNVEDLVLDGAALKATGNARNNLIVGNAGHNILDGGAGVDTMHGGDGWDSYYVDNLKDLVVENANEGWDVVYSTAALTQGFANVEDYHFTKATSAVNFTGTDDGNRIYSSAFNDTLAGGAGNDVYYFNNAGDKVVEQSGQGIDVVFSTVSIANLAQNVESVILQGSAALNATGNALDNHLSGNDGKNVLKGGYGNDALDGRHGSDTLTGGGGADKFEFWDAAALSGHDVITDFDRDNDILAFMQAGDSDGDGNFGEYEDFVASIVDKGAGNDVVLHLIGGASITFKGIGTGSIDHITDLVANPATQILSD